VGAWILAEFWYNRALAGYACVEIYYPVKCGFAALAYGEDLTGCKNF